MLKYEKKSVERIVLPTGSVFQKQGYGEYRVGQGFHFRLFQKQCVGGL